MTADVLAFSRAAAGAEAPPDRRWFRCEHCRDLFVGPPIDEQPAADEGRAYVQHETTCSKDASVPAPRQPFAEIAGLTTDDCGWLAEQIRLATGGIEPAGDAGRDGRFYLECGHQMGGPFGYAASDCPTCTTWLAENPAAAATEPVRTPTPAQSRRPPMMQWLMLAALLLMAFSGAGLFIVTGDLPGILPLAVMFYVVFFLNRRARQ